ncbi:MAG: aspartyl protease [Spirochaetes bacterium]|mgnify:CR=1 FL=1|nr:MAG: aspartyl protease [Spirochaetota bacterium]
MGLTYVDILIKKSYEDRDSQVVTFMIDSGAVYSVVNRKVLESLGIKAHRKKSFILADGSKVEREIGDAYFEYKGVGGAAPVIFGEKNDINLLGSTTLEALELILDPFQRELRPMTLTLVGVYPRYSPRNRERK